MKIFQDLLKKTHYDQTIGVVMANDGDVIAAVTQAKKRELANFILYGPKKHIEHLLKKYHYNQMEVVNCASALICLEKVANDLKANKIQLIMKGLISTKLIMQMILNKDNHLVNTNYLLSHVAILQLKDYHKPLFLTDAAINIAPNGQQKIQIINNALELMQSLHYVSPKIALLSAIEEVSIKIPSTIEADELTKLPASTWKWPCQIQGPMGLDSAISKQAAQIKQIASTITGDVDLLIMPNIESGNILYKSLVYFADAFSMGIVLGAKIPIILTSRADDNQSKLFSITLALWFSNYQKSVNKQKEIENLMIIKSH